MGWGGEGSGAAPRTPRPPARRSNPTATPSRLGTVSGRVDVAERGVLEAGLGDDLNAAESAGCEQRRHGIEAAVLVMDLGDDLLDLPVLRKVGFSATPSNGRPELQAVVHYVAETPGGFGVVREVVEMILKAKGLWERIIATDGRP